MSNSTNSDSAFPALRLAWIERRAARVGTIQRKEICEAFDISLAQASSDLQRIQELLPGCLDYDLKAKHYRWTRKERRFHFPPPSFLDEFRA